MIRAWTTSEAIAERQGCSRTYLREMMDATPDTMTRPWVIKGTGKGRSARYSWEVARVDQWWREVHEWRAKSDAVIAGVSGGVPSPARLTLVSAPPARSQTNSSARSKGRTRSAATGRLPPASSYRSSRT